MYMYMYMYFVTKVTYSYIHFNNIGVFRDNFNLKLFSIGGCQSWVYKLCLGLTILYNKKQKMLYSGETHQHSILEGSLGFIVVCTSPNWQMVSNIFPKATSIKWSIILKEKIFLSFIHKFYIKCIFDDSILTIQLYLFSFTFTCISKN